MFEKEGIRIPYPQKGVHLEKNMYVIQEVKQEIIQELKKAVGKGFSPDFDSLSIPPDPQMGDVAFPCFELAKKLKQNPNEIAAEIAAKIGPKGSIDSIKAVGPYVNFVLNDKVFGTKLLEEINELGEEYGTSDVGANKKIMVEYANLNTHKDIHVGHLRNLFVGQTTVNILKANGYDVIPVSYINDLGLHVAKSVWAMRAFHKGEELPEGEDRMEFLRKVYVEANQKLEEEPDLKKDVTKTFKGLEMQTGDDIDLWKKTRGWSIDYLKQVYSELDIVLDHWYFESELITKTKKIINELIKQGVVVESDGAWIVDLSDQGLGVNLLIKSDGTLLYNAKDLALALKKEDDYHPTRSIYVVDNRQSHALEQLFATLRLMNFDHELVHLSYDFVTLASGAMASRKGNVIRYEVFRDRMFKQAWEETQKRHPEWKEKQVEAVSHTVAFAAMRFGMLKQDTEKKLVFDLDEALSFDGFTGPYLLYTYARISSILRKAKRNKMSFSSNHLKERQEHNLLGALAEYPEVLFRVSQNLQLSQVAHYLFDLSKLFSEFYASVPVLKADKKVKAERLALLKGIHTVLRSGLNVLGIEPIEEM